MKIAESLGVPHRFSYLEIEFVFIPHGEDFPPSPYWISRKPINSTDEVNTFNAAKKYCHKLNQQKTSPVISSPDVHCFFIATEDDLSTPLVDRPKSDTTILTRIESPDSLPALELRDKTRTKRRADTKLSSFVFFLVMRFSSHQNHPNTNPKGHSDD